jgi:hypothetical protein
MPACTKIGPISDTPILLSFTLVQYLHAEEFYKKYTFSSHTHLSHSAVAIVYHDV